LKSNYELASDHVTTISVKHPDDHPDDLS